MQTKIKKRVFLALFMFFIIFTPLKYCQPIIIMLSPAGDSANRGRDLNSSYERGTAFQWTQDLKKELENRDGIEVILSHRPNEKLEPLQIAQFSNRLDADLFISLHLYAQQKPNPQISLFHLVRDPFLDFSLRKTDALQIIPLYKSHLKNIHLTKAMANKMETVLKNTENKPFCQCTGVFGIPLAAHAGILAPAIAIEAGICQDEMYKGLTKPCAQAILTALKEVYHENTDNLSSNIPTVLH